MESREEQLDAMTERVRAVITAQREDADPAHEDWYAWGYALSEVTAQLNHLCRVLSAQVLHYGDRRILRDDAGADPHQRLEAMSQHLVTLAGEFNTANATARAFHSEASHIAVEVNP